VIRLGKIIAALLLLIVLAGGAGIWLGIPYLERRWTFQPVKESPQKPWDLPQGAEKVSFRASDGVRLAGWYFEGAAPSTGITLLVLHGSYGYLPVFVPDIEFMRRRGFNVLLFNFRGFGMSDGTTLGEATLDRDAEAALRYLTKDRGIDPRSIAFIGASIGGPIAVNLAARSACRAVAVVGGIASARRQMRMGRPWVPAIVLDNLSSPLDAAGTIAKARCPVLVVHGAGDTVVPPSDAHDVHAAARPPKRLILVPGAQHAFEGVDHSLYLEGMASFFIDPK
jgi:pimeloyl-ACP methyl ester carboxylesterase